MRGSCFRRNDDTHFARKPSPLPSLVFGKGG